MNGPKSAEPRSSALGHCKPASVYVPGGWPDHTALAHWGNIWSRYQEERHCPSAQATTISRWHGFQGTFVCWKCHGISVLVTHRTGLEFGSSLDKQCSKYLWSGLVHLPCPRHFSPLLCHCQLSGLLIQEDPQPWMS